MLLADYFSVIKFIVFCLIIDLSHQVAHKGEKVRDARTEEFPSIVSIGAKSASGKNVHFCSGTLISEKHVLTAAYCLAGLNPVDIYVAVGSNDLKRAIKYFPSHWKTYEEWKNPAKYGTVMVHDIAVITLSSSVTDIKPSELNEHEDLTGTTLKIAGWRYTYNAEKPAIMKIASLEVISNDECNDNLSILTNNAVSVSEYNLCSKQDPWILTECGDSGGPSFDEDNKLVGVTVGRCPLEGFTVDLAERIVLQMNANRYRDFIDSVTKEP